MTQADSTSEKKTSSKKSRNPVERAVVWGLIAIFGVVAVIEFRAKRGFDSSLEYIQKRVDEFNSVGDGKNAAPVKLSELRQHLSGGPSWGENDIIKMLSLFKRYELILVVNDDNDEGIVFDVRPAEPGVD